MILVTAMIPAEILAAIVDVTKKSYLLQTKEKGYSGCFLISLLNARIYYGHPYIDSLDDPLWEKMVDKYGCRYGGCIRRPQIVKDLKLRIKKVDRDDIPNNLPVAITSFTKVGFHHSLVIDVKNDNWTIVNYNGYKGKLIEIVNKKDIDFIKKGNINDKHYHIWLRKRKN